MPLNRLGISWQINDYTTSGNTALHVCMNLLSANGPKPLLYAMPRLISPPPGVFEKLRPYVEEMELLIEKVNHSQKAATLNQVLALHGVFVEMQWEDISSKLLGRHNVGVSFFRELPTTLEAAKRGRALDRLIVRSRWHEEGLRDLGLDNVIYWRPGYDDWLLYPRDAQKADDEPFSVYSAGPLSIQNAQDIVVAAFKAFHARHPDSRLVTCWQSPYVGDVPTLELSPHGLHAPKIGDKNSVDILGWLTGNGLAEDAVTDSGIIGAQSYPTYLAQADVALFPNRCSGGPNAHAIEAMAMGVPCILSANTGHLDLIEGDNVLKLEKQKPLNMPSINTAGWGESDIDEIVAQLEWAYENRSALREVGKRGAESVKPYTWAQQTRTLLDLVSDLMAAD